MWWLALCLVVLLGGEASALVIMDPPMVRKCPKAKTWAGVATCLGNHGTVKVMHTLKGARLVSLTQRQDGRTIDGGVFLYVERGGEWRIGGHWAGGSEYQVLAFEALTIGKQVGYRLDIGQASPMTVMLDGQYPVRGLMRQKRSLFCSGDHYGCPDATSTCEILVRGNALYTFRGSLKIDGNIVYITGDRSKAGPCAPTDRMFLGWRD